MFAVNAFWEPLPHFTSAKWKSLSLTLAADGANKLLQSVFLKKKNERAIYSDYSEWQGCHMLPLPTLLLCAWWTWLIRQTPEPKPGFGLRILPNNSGHHDSVVWPWWKSICCHQHHLIACILIIPVSRGFKDSLLGYDDLIRFFIKKENSANWFDLTT